MEDLSFLLIRPPLRNDKFLWFTKSDKPKTNADKQQVWSEISILWVSAVVNSFKFATKIYVSGFRLLFKQVT